MITKRIVEIFIIFLFEVSFSQAWRPFNLFFENVQCSSTFEAADNLNCSLSETSSKQMALNINLKMKATFNKPKLNFGIITKRPGQKQTDILLNVTNLNFCWFLEYKLNSPLLYKIRNELDNFSQLPKRCPLEKGVEIKLNKFLFSAEKLPPYTPDLNFRVELKGFEETTTIVDISIAGKIVSKNKNLKIGVKKL